MAIRKINPTSPGQRGMTKSDYSEITTSTPEKRLLKPIKKHAGRNNTGRITCRHKGGGVKQHYRIIDFKRNKVGVPGTVMTIEYDEHHKDSPSIFCLKEDTNQVKWLFDISDLILVEMADVVNYDVDDETIITAE